MTLTLAMLCERCTKVGRTLRSTLREIFDESAYARFLARRQVATSPQAYADFLRELQTQRERRPRCC
jgi:Selenoprotein, putative